MREFLFLEMEVAFPSQKKTLQKNELVAAALIEKQRNINEYISGFISKWTIKAPTDHDNWPPSQQLWILEMTKINKTV